MTNERREEILQAVMEAKEGDLRTVSDLEIWKAVVSSILDLRPPTFETTR